MCNSFRQLSLYGWRGKKQRRAGCSAHSLSHWRVPSPTSPSLLALRSSPGSRESIYQVDTEAHGKEKSFQDGSRVADLADCKQNGYHSWTQWNFSSFFYKPSEIANSLPGIMPGGYWNVIINHINIILKGFHQSRHALCSRRVSLSHSGLPELCVKDKMHRCTGFFLVSTKDQFRVVTWTPRWQNVAKLQ